MIDYIPHPAFQKPGGLVDRAINWYYSFMYTKVISVSLHGQHAHQTLPVTEHAIIGRSLGEPIHGTFLSVFPLTDAHVLKVPRSDCRFVRDAHHHRSHVLDGLALAQARVPELIPDHDVLTDVSWYDHRDELCYAPWGILSERIVCTLGERIQELLDAHDTHGLNELRQAFVRNQHRMWEQGLWNWDINPLKNYGLLKNGCLCLIDIDLNSISNDPIERPYDPAVYDELPGHAQTFFEPISIELCFSSYRKKLNGSKDIS